MDLDTVRRCFCWCWKQLKREVHVLGALMDGGRADDVDSCRPWWNVSWGHSARTARRRQARVLLTVIHMLPASNVPHIDTSTALDQELVILAVSLLQ